MAFPIIQACGVWWGNLVIRLELVEDSRDLQIISRFGEYGLGDCIAGPKKGEEMITRPLCRQQSSIE